MDADDMCVLAGDREVRGPLAAALAAGCRFAFAGCFGFGRAALVLFGFALAGALLFGFALAGALLFGFALAGALLFGFALAGALLFGGALVAGVAFLGRPRFFGASEGALAAGFRGFAAAGDFTARGPLAGAARGVLAGACRAPGVV